MVQPVRNYISNEKDSTSDHVLRNYAWDIRSLFFEGVCLIQVYQLGFGLLIQELNAKKVRQSKNNMKRIIRITKKEDNGGGKNRVRKRQQMVHISHSTIVFNSVVIWAVAVLLSLEVEFSASNIFPYLDVVMFLPQLCGVCRLVDGLAIVIGHAASLCRMWMKELNGWVIASSCQWIVGRPVLLSSPLSPIITSILLLSLLFSPRFSGLRSSIYRNLSS